MTQAGQEEIRRALAKGEPVRDVVVDSDLAFAQQRFARPVVFENCQFKGLVNLSGARFLWSLIFTGCEFDAGLRMTAAW